MEAKEIRWWEVEERPDKREAIKKIENRRRRDIFELLFANGIKSKSGNWHDYSRAKRLCFEGLFINSEIYDKQIKWIGDYLGL